MALATPPQLHQVQPCYVSVSSTKRQRLDTFATGFQPNADVDVTIDGATQIDTANDLGAVDLRRIAAPYERRGQRSFTITVTERGDPTVTVSATAWVTALTVRLRPRQAGTSERVRFRGRGFTQDRPIFGHYVLRGRVRRTVRLARRPRGACGRFSVRRRQIPLRNPAPGRWLLQVDQQRRWSSQPDSVFVPVTILVQRIIG
jgi:hypothetical protein